jgi:hypothetical protein
MHRDLRCTEYGEGVIFITVSDQKILQRKYSDNYHGEKTNNQCAVYQKVLTAHHIVDAAEWLRKNVHFTVCPCRTKS